MRELQIFTKKIELIFSVSQCTGLIYAKLVIIKERFSCFDPIFDYLFVGGKYSTYIYTYLLAG